MFPQPPPVGHCGRPLLESLHYSRPMLDAGSGSGVELFGTGLWQDGAICSSRCFIVCSSPRSHNVRPSSLYLLLTVSIVVMELICGEVAMSNATRKLLYARDLATVAENKREMQKALDDRQGVDSTVHRRDQHATEAESLRAWRQLFCVGGGACSDDQSVVDM